MRLSRTSRAAALVVLMLGGCSREEEKSVTFDTPDGKGKLTVHGSGEDGKGRYTYEGAEGKVTHDATESGYKTTYTDKDGKTQTTEVSTKVDTAAFEGFLYPNAKPQSEEGSVMSSVVNGMATVTGGFVTPDKPEAVLEHYKKAIPGATVSTAGSMSTLFGKTPKGADVSVMITTDDEGKTLVNVTLIKKS